MNCQKKWFVKYELVYIVPLDQHRESCVDHQRCARGRQSWVQFLQSEAVRESVRAAVECRLELDGIIRQHSAEPTYRRNSSHPESSSDKETIKWHTGSAFLICHQQTRRAMGENTAEVIVNKHENSIDTRYFSIIKQTSNQSYVFLSNWYSFLCIVSLMWSFCVLLDSTPNNVKISIPQELLQSGKTLTIEKSSEQVVSGHHVSQPIHPIPQTHGLCLIDTQRQDQTSVTAVHQLQDNIGDSGEFSRVIIFIGVMMIW